MPEMNQQSKQTGSSIWQISAPQSAPLSFRKTALCIDSHLLFPLQAAILYDQDELLDTTALIEQCPPGDGDTIVNEACVLYKEAMGVDGGEVQPMKLEVR
jgi:hypothetical protein